MTKKSLTLFSLLVLAALMPQATRAQGLARNGRWLTYDGNTPYYVGWFTAQIHADPTVDCEAKLDLLEGYGINKVRIWISNYYDESSLQPWTFDPATHKYNLDSWNPVFWSRTRNFVSQARARGILVEVSIFPVNDLNKPENFDGTMWATPWNKVDNVNGVFTKNSLGHFLPQFFNLSLTETSTSLKTLKNYQQALIDKTLAELGGYDNVYFEVMNEFPGNDPAVASATDAMVYGWHQFWLDYIGARTTRLVTAHAQQGWGPNTTGIANYWNRPSVDVLNFHLYTYDATTISGLLHSAQSHGRVLTNNEGDGYRNTNGTLNTTNLNKNTVFAWGMLLAGGYFDWIEGDPNDIGDTAWQAAANRAKSMRTIAESLRFQTMSPVDGAGAEIDNKITQGPAAKWQLLAELGQQYLAYFWGTSATTTAAKINLPAGTYTYTWYNVTNAAVLGTGTVTGSTATTIAAPATSQWTPAAGLALTLKLGSMVSVTASDSDAAEIGPNTGQFRFTRSGSTSSALTVSYTLGGTAVNGSDYTSLATSVSFAAGQSTVTRTVTPINDSLVEDAETVALTLVAGSGYSVAGPATATVTITNDDYVACTTTATKLCLLSGRFEVTLSADNAGTEVTGHAVVFSDAAGAFWLFSSSNIEVVAKVLDGSAINNQFWVFHGAATTLSYTLTVKDRANPSRVKVYCKAPGTLCGGTDIQAFLKKSSTGGLEPIRLDMDPLAPVTGAAFTCVPNATTLCLLGNRFQVRVLRGTAYQNAVPLTSATGMFWFFSASNIELFVKVLDGTAINGKYWVFFGSMTAETYTVEVTDSVTGLIKTYTRTPAEATCGLADTAAF